MIQPSTIPVAPSSQDIIPVGQKQIKKEKKNLWSIFNIVTIIALTVITFFFVARVAKTTWFRSRAYNENVITLGQDLLLNLDTDLPDNLKDVKFYVIKKQNSQTIRSEKFGASGAHGEWDLLPGMTKLSNARWQSDKTGDEMLEKHYAMLEAIGIKWIRFDQSGERMGSLENLNFTYPDKVVAAAKRHNLNIMMSLGYAPNWLTTQCPAKAKITPPRQVWYFSPKDTDRNGSEYFNQFVQKMVERYKPYGAFDRSSGYGISYWQIWNEPDNYYWIDCETGQSGNADKNIVLVQKKYAALLRSAYSAIKSVDPQAKVISGGMMHINPTKALTDLYNLSLSIGPEKNFDIIDLHNYEDVGSFTGKINGFAQVRNKYGDGAKEIWLSETSAPSQQSDYLKSIFEEFEQLSPSLNLGKAFWWTTRGYFFTDKGNPEESRKALFENNFYPRKVYFDFGEWLGTIKYKGEVPALSVKKGKISVVIGKKLLNEIGEYTIFYASPTKMITALPFSVEVKDGNISTPTQKVDSNLSTTPIPATPTTDDRPTATPANAPNCANPGRDCWTGNKPCCYTDQDGTVANTVCKQVTGTYWACQKQKLDSDSSPTESILITPITDSKPTATPTNAPNCANPGRDCWTGNKPCCYTDQDGTVANTVCKQVTGTYWACQKE